MPAELVPCPRCIRDSDHYLLRLHGYCELCEARGRDEAYVPSDLAAAYRLALVEPLEDESTVYRSSPVGWQLILNSEKIARLKQLFTQHDDEGR